jgi:hypothetical protein
MSQNTSVESSTPTTPNPSINPVLQAALTSLDVQLEEELAHYRRQRAGRPVTPARGLSRYQARKPLDLIAVDQGQQKTQRPALGMSTAPQISFPLVMNPMPTATPDRETNQELADQSDQQYPPSSLSSDPTSPLVTSAWSNADAAHSTQGVRESLTPPDKRAEPGGDLVPLAAAQSQPEDYLESSEQLLRSLSEEQADTAPKKRFADRFLSPLGVGSILLLLLTSTTLIYIVKHPSTLSALRLNGLFAAKTATTAQTQTKTTQAKSTPTRNTPTLKGPDLTSQEFPEVNLDTLSHLDANGSPTPTPSAVPSVSNLPEAGGTTQVPPVPNSALPPGRSGDISSALLPSQGQQGTAPSRIAPVAPLPSLPTAMPRMNKSNSSLAPNLPTTTQQSKASSTAPQGAESAASVRSGFYYVLLNYGSDRDLAKAKTAVPDAYVERFPQGSQIQMGAFKRESQAKSLVERLKAQGINASIYHP